ncbi:AMP-binding protein [Paracoccus aerius]|uniref:AMP-binding protein n=1 Tax=Paracoccus aerius TaxID=1915382 RepID=A0ABS1SDN0_9RHOB|nr:AMP-binding protein [Paracoccus aerius]MBL3675817.1 AMP-binding protein [Paracoccus aerius]GHG37482.1 AMP-dependent ligase [Paracoccus aerius]
MKLDPHNPPQGTIREWLDYRADHQGGTISHLFPESGLTLTWRELRDEAACIATHLSGLGLIPGESVALMLPNGRNSVLGLFGVLYGGFRATMINLVAGADAIGYAVSHSAARALLLGPAQHALFQAALAVHPAKLMVIEAGDGFDWPAGCQPGPLHPHGPCDDALLMYTSGTTGRPKGVVHNHASLLAGGWTPALAHDLRPSDRALCVLPLYHINGLCVTLLGPLLSGGSVTVCERFSASRFWAFCDQYEATWFSVVPTIISHLLHGECDPSAECRARIRFGRSASAALAPEVQAGFEHRFGVPIVETMGLTETAAQILSNPLPPSVRKIGSPGRAVGNEVAIMSSDMHPLPPGAEGEIAVRGANVMRGYLNDPVATAAALTTGGWLRTGDLGRMDEDGYVFVTGRLKELIIKGGENIAPREIDEALYTHPDVVEAAAFARKCDRYGEQVEAAVTLRPGSSLQAPDLITICEQRLGKFKAPGVIHLMAELPKGPSGKIQRLKLAQLTQ